ncbi:MAG TPA: hypothetical protein VI916_07520 [Acidimicrobiia bacterium]|nr:hypothetical protein [Acidimicrobiia bacterium]
MTIDVGLLAIDGAVFHQVPAGARSSPAGDSPEPVLSTVESKLDGRLQFFLRDRLTRTFMHAAQPIIRDEDIQTPTPELVRTALEAGAEADIVSPFHALPARLLDVQAHNSPRGLLAVIRGACGTTRVVILVKVEQERGLSFDTFKEGSEVRVEVVIEDGLVFTDKTEIFKAALFYMEDAALVGLLTDDQTGSVYKGPSSLFWVREFLGCRYSREADVMTRAWIRATQRLIKSDLVAPEDKDSVLSAMLAELASNRTTIDPSRFIANYVPEAAQDDARQRLLNEGASATRFPKSREVSSRAPTRKKLEFDTGYEVTMPADLTPDLGKETLDGEELDVLTIRGHLRRVGA